MAVPIPHAGNKLIDAEEQKEDWYDRSPASGAAMAGNEFETQAGRNVLQARHDSWITVTV